MLAMFFCCCKIKLYCYSLRKDVSYIFTFRFLVSRREATLKEEYGSNIPAHLLVPPVGPNQVFLPSIVELGD